MQIEECGDGVQPSTASIGFTLPGISIVMDFIDREGFKIIVKKFEQKPDQDIQVGRKGETEAKAINSALTFANLSLVETTEVQAHMERFLSKYFYPPALKSIAEESAVAH